MIVHWTEAALTDLRAVNESIGRHSPRYARAMIERIFAQSELLSSYPRLGPMVQEFEDESLRELFENPYRIIDPQIDVVAVVHAARRLPRGL